MGDLYLQLLGAFVAQRAGAAPIVLPTRKAQALLAILALAPGRLQARERLAAMLWGDTPEPRARQSLRQALAFLRQRLEADIPLFISDGDGVALAPQAVEVDVPRFEQLLRDDSTPALEQAAALYRGDLLEHLALNEPSFEEWLGRERHRLSELAVAALLRLLERQSAAEQPARALTTAQRVLALDPLQEPAYRSIMRLQAAQGRRGAALRQYQLCAETLARELGVAPSTETRDLYRQLLLQSQPSAAVAELPDTPRLLIGRDAEMAALVGLMDAGWRGQGAVALLSGEAGVGKTRLLEALSAAAAQRGGRVLVGRCYQSEHILPFHGWVDALRSDAAATAAAVARLESAQRAELARLLPEIGPPRQRAARHEDYLRLFQTLADVMLGLADERPLLVVLENLHWADEMTARMLAFIGRRLKARPVLLLGSLREEEPPAAPAVGVALDELAADRLLQRIELAPLSQPHTYDLVAALAGAGVEAGPLAALEQEVWRSSEGNPFVIVETMRALEGRRDRLPRSVRQATRRRLRRLSPMARQLAHVAAVLGDEVEFGPLLRAAGLAMAVGADAVEELVRHRVLEADRDTFRFVHARVRAVIYGDLLPPRRAALHATVVAALEVEFAGRLQTAYGRLAHHAAKAGDDERAVMYLLALAEDAGNRYAVDASISLLYEALVHAARLPPERRDRAALDAVHRLYESLIFAGRVKEAVSLLQAHAPSLVRLNDDDLAARHHFAMAYAYSFFDARDPMLHHGERCLELATRAGDRVMMGRGHFLIARACNRHGEASRCLEHAQEAVELLQFCSDSVWLGWAYWMLAVAYDLPGRFAEMQVAASKARDIGASCGDLRLQTWAAITIGWSFIGRMDTAGAVEVSREAVDLAPDIILRSMAKIWLGSALVQHHAAAEAVQVIMDARRQLQECGAFQFMVVWGGMNLGIAYLELGQLDQAEHFAAAAVAEAAPIEYALGLGRAQRVLGQVALARGALADAEAHLRRSEATLSAANARTPLAITELTLAEVLHARGRTADARTLLHRARARLQALGLVQQVARADALAMRLTAA